MSGTNLHKRIAALYLARMEHRPLGLDQIEKFRQDFLMLMKNAKVVRDYDQAWEWREAVRIWRSQFKLFAERMKKGISNLRFQKRLNSSDADYWLKRLGADLWSLNIEFRVPIEPLAIGRDMWGGLTDDQIKERLFIKMKQELPKWEGRVRRASRDAWSALKDFTIWYKRQSEGSLIVDIPTDERINMDGFSVIVKGFDPDSQIASLYADGMERFKVGLKRYKQRAKTVLPILLQGQLPIVLDFTMGVDEGGLYESDHIDINPMAAHPNPGRMAQILAHEMGHHVYKNYLSKADREFWSRAITGNLGTLDFNEVLRKYGDDRSLFDNERIKQEDPILYLQLQGLYDDPYSKHSFQNILGMDELRTYLANGGQAKLVVHGKPITGYASKNHEEAFCEAIGMLVGYGPRTVLPEVQDWLKTILPQIRIASEIQVTARKQETIDLSWIDAVRRTWKVLSQEVASADYMSARDKLANLSRWTTALQRDLAFTKGFFTFLRGDKTTHTDIYKWRVKALTHLEAAGNELAKAKRDIEFWDGVVTPGTRDYRNGTGHRYVLVEQAAKDQRLSPPLSSEEADQMIADNPRLIERALSKQIHAIVEQGLKRADHEISRKLLALLTRIINKWGEIEWGTLDREFSIGDVKVVMQDLVYEGTPVEQRDERNPVQVTDFVRELIKAKRLLELKGLGKLWYGTFLIKCKSCGGTNPLGVRFGVGAHYFPSTDSVVIYADPTPGLARLVAHELGHRYYYKFMSQGDRARFDQWFGEVPAVSEYGGTISEEDFAEVFSYYIDNRDLSRDQIERFKRFIKTSGRSESSKTIDQTQMRLLASRIAKRYLPYYAGLAHH